MTSSWARHGQTLSRWRLDLTVISGGGEGGGGVMAVVKVKEILRGSTNAIGRWLPLAP